MTIKYSVTAFLLFANGLALLVECGRGDAGMVLMHIILCIGLVVYGFSE